MPGGLVMSSGQDDVIWSGCASPSGDHREVIWRSGMCADIGFDVGRESSKRLRSRLVRTRVESLPHTSACSILVI